MNTGEATTLPAGSWVSPERRPVTTMVATNFLSTISNQMTGIAVPWFVLTLTGSASQTGLTAAVTLLPSVFMSFFGGAIADRMSAKKLSIFADIMSSATVALVPLLFMLDLLSFPMLLLLMFFGAVFDAPGSTARTTLLPRLADRASIPVERINSAYGVSQSVSSIIGAVISGLLIGLLGATTVLWFNAATFAISALGMLLFVPELGANPSSGASLLADVKAGFSYVWRDKLIRTIILASLVINCVYSPMFGVMMPYYAKTELNSATALGFIAAAFGAGSLIGALSYGFIGERMTKRAQLIVSAALISLPIAGLIPVPSFGWTMAIILLCSVGSGLVNPMIFTMLMKRTPQHMLGRVMGVISAGAMIASPFGMIAVGPAIDQLGLQGTFAVIAAVLFGIFLIILFNRTLRSIDVVVEPEPGVA